MPLFSMGARTAYAHHRLMPQFPALLQPDMLAITFRSGNRKLLHHAIGVFLRKF
ncbi:MAG: hypothetical protein KA045_01895 [Burkholderiaceae bacterium]|nr:hypothetical protein [Burkholderiaceae bacterium]